MSGLFGENELPENKNYTVLARKYRPQNLDELIGQEALVRTLRNALKTGRLAHAFLLTGIRGVGKTTTARIIARTLNNIPAGQPVDQNIDVIEMDAASNTGVDNVREIIEAAKYKPLSSPYKIYIIDEVHMLSKGAFNALLKTLEEPPGHVKFIFATTEIRKIPVTILSRCQRFDLRRVETDVLSEHLKKIAAAEKIEVEDGAIRLIANAAEGSVRDSLSLLDQSIAYAEGKVSTALVQEMLGYADRSKIIALFETLLGGKIAEALDIFAEICQTSAEPSQIINELLEFCHLVTRLKVTPSLRPDQVPESEYEAAKRFAAQLPLPVLARVWQMLAKSFNELRYAPNPKQAVEMALIRIAYATDLPDPGDLIRDIKKNGSLTAPGLPPKNAPAQESFAPVATQAEVETQEPAVHNPLSYTEMVELFRAKRELIIHSTLRSDVHLVGFKPEKLEIRLTPEAPKDLSTRLINCLNEWTGKRWAVIISNEEGAPTIVQQEKAAREAIIAEVKDDALVRQTLETFPGAEVKEVIPQARKQAENLAAS